MLTARSCAKAMTVDDKAEDRAIFFFLVMNMWYDEDSRSTEQKRNDRIKIIFAVFLASWFIVGTINLVLRFL